MTGRGIWDNLWLLKCLAIKTNALNVTTANFFFLFFNILPFIFFFLLDALHCVPTVDSYRWGLPLSSDFSALFLEAEKTRGNM